MKRIFTFLFFIIITNNYVYSQGVFLDEEGGLQVSGMIATASDPDILGYGVNAGYTPNGLIDFGFSYGRSTISDFGITIYGNTFSPSISVNLLKDEIVSLSLDVNYAYTSYGSSSFPDNIDVHSNSFSAGGMLYKKFSVSEKLRFIPAISVSHFSENLVTNNDDIPEESINLTIYDFSTVFNFKLKSGRQIYLGVEYSTDDYDNSTFTFGIGIIIPDAVAAK